MEMGPPAYFVRSFYLYMQSKSGKGNPKSVVEKRLTSLMNDHQNSFQVQLQVNSVVVVKILTNMSGFVYISQNRRWIPKFHEVKSKLTLWYQKLLSKAECFTLLSVKCVDERTCLKSHGFFQTIRELKVLASLQTTT